MPERLYSWTDLDELRDDLESTLGYVEGYVEEEPFHIFNNLKEASDFLADKIIITELMK